MNPRTEPGDHEWTTTNLGLNTSLLSRFDLIMPVMDAIDDKWDAEMVSFLLEKETDKAADEFTQEDLQLHLQLAKVMKPVWDDAAAYEVISAYYSICKQDPLRDCSRTTVRLQESLIRLTSAHARLCCRTRVTVVDAVVAVLLMESSIGFRKLFEPLNWMEALEARLEPSKDTIRMVLRVLKVSEELFNDDEYFSCKAGRLLNQEGRATLTESQVGRCGAVKKQVEERKVKSPGVSALQGYLNKMKGDGQNSGDVGGPAKKRRTEAESQKTNDKVEESTEPFQETNSSLSALITIMEDEETPVPDHQDDFELLSERIGTNVSGEMENLVPIVEHKPVVQEENANIVAESHPLAVSYPHDSHQSSLISLIRMMEEEETAAEVDFDMLSQAIESGDNVKKISDVGTTKPTNLNNLTTTKDPSVIDDHSEDDDDDSRNDDVGLSQVSFHSLMKRLKPPMKLPADDQTHQDTGNDEETLQVRLNDFGSTQAREVNCEPEEVDQSEARMDSPDVFKTQVNAEEDAFHDLLQEDSLDDHLSQMVIPGEEPLGQPIVSDVSIETVMTARTPVTEEIIEIPCTAPQNSSPVPKKLKEPTEDMVPEPTLEWFLSTVDFSPLDKFPKRMFDRNDRFVPAFPTKDDCEEVPLSQ